MASTTVTARPPQPINWRSTADVKRVGKELLAEFKKDNVTSLAAAFAYHTVFAIPALLILMVTIAAVVNLTTNVDVTGNLRELIAERAPSDTQDLLNGIVDNAVDDVSGGGASVGVLVTALVALWSGSNAVGALIDAFNRAYGVKESRKWLRKKGLTIALTLLLAVFVNVAFALLVFGERIGSWIADQAGLGGAFDLVWNLLRWPIAIAAVGLLLTILFWAGPNVEQSFRWVSPGSILSTFLWLMATGGIGLYLRFSNPGSAYGAVGSVLVLLFFLYVTGIVFLLGSELNALIAKRYDPETIADLAASGDADLEPRLEAQAVQSEGGASRSPQWTPRPTPPSPAGGGPAGIAVTAGVVALSKGIGGLTRHLRRRRG